MSDQNELRNRFDDKNTDKYYRSAAKSVFADQPIDSTTMKHGEKPQPGPLAITATLADLDDKNTDRYYRAKDRTPTPQQVAATKAGRPGGHRVKIGDVPVHGMAAVQSTVPGQLMLTDAKEINSVVHSAVNMVLHGPVTISVFGDPALVMRLRTRLELLVTRETITEDQYRDIVIVNRSPAQPQVLKETRTPDQIYGEPVAKEEGREKPLLSDPMDFLKADDVEEEKLPEAPPPVEVTDDFLQEDEPVPAGAPSNFLSAVTQPVEAAEVDDLFDRPAEEKNIEKAPVLPEIPAPKKGKKGRRS